MPKGNKSKKKKEKHQEDGKLHESRVTDRKLPCHVHSEGATVQSGLVQDEDSESVCSSLPDSTVSDEGTSINEEGNYRVNITLHGCHSNSSRPLPLYLSNYSVYVRSL